MVVMDVIERGVGGTADCGWGDVEEEVRLWWVTCLSLN